MAQDICWFCLRQTAASDHVRIPNYSNVTAHNLWAAIKDIKPPLLAQHSKPSLTGMANARLLCPRQDCVACLWAVYLHWRREGTRNKRTPSTFSRFLELREMPPQITRQSMETETAVHSVSLCLLNIIESFFNLIFPSKPFSLHL